MKNEKIVWIWMVFMTLFIGCLSTEEPKSSEKNNDIDGKKIYQKYCVSCHGVQGDLGLNGAVHLHKSVLSIDEKIIVITKGRNTMTAFEKILSSDEIKSVALYTEQFKSN